MGNHSGGGQGPARMMRGGAAALMPAACTRCTVRAGPCFYPGHPPHTSTRKSTAKHSRPSYPHTRPTPAFPPRHAHSSCPRTRRTPAASPARPRMYFLSARPVVVPYGPAASDAQARQRRAAAGAPWPSSPAVRGGSGSPGRVCSCLNACMCIWKRGSGAIGAALRPDAPVWRGTPL